MLKFNIERIRALLVRDFHMSFKPTMKIIGVILLVYYLVNLFIAVVNRNDTVDDFELSPTIITYGLFLLIGGLIYSSRAFREFAKVPSRAEYLSLPASSLEKVLVKWLYTGPIFLVAFTLLFWILASLFMPFISDLRGYEFSSPLFVTIPFWNLVGIYSVVQTIFIFGSITFNKVPAVLTVISIMLIALIALLICAIFFRMVWAEYFEGLYNFAEQSGNFRYGDGTSDPSEKWQVKFFIFAFKFLLAPVMFVASIFKLSEKHV